MNNNNHSGFHYFVQDVQDRMNRCEMIQAWVVNEILNSKLPQEARESSVQWELMHSSGVMQLARVLARKRGVDEELATVAATLHDICVITNGTYENHGVRGGQITRELLTRSGDFSASETDLIADAISNHSDKQIYSEDKLTELIKDADTFDVFLYGEHVYDYKPKDKRIHYWKRMASISRELGLPIPAWIKKQLKNVEEF